MANKLVIRCEERRCKHNSGGLVCCICTHPELINSVPYNGSVRIYHQNCPKKELTNNCHAADENGTPIFVREDDFCFYGFVDFAQDLADVMKKHGVKNISPACACNESNYHHIRIRDDGSLEMIGMKIDSGRERRDDHE